MAPRGLDPTAGMTATRARRLALTALPALLIVLFGAALLVTQQRAQRTVHEMDRILLEARQLEGFLDLLLVLENRQREHLMTGNVGFLVAYNGARDRLDTQLDSVSAILGRNHGPARPHELARLVRDRVARLDSGIVLLRAQGRDSAYAFVGGGAGPRMMSRIRDELTSHQHESREAYLARAAERQRRDGWLFGITLVGTVLAVGSTLATAAGLERALRQQEDANRLLNAQASDLEGQTIELEELLEAQRESEERFHALTDFAADLTFVVDARGTITYASHAIERVLGHSPATLMATPLIDIVHPDDEPIVEATLIGLVKNPHTTGEFEVRVRNADRDWCIIAARARSLLDMPSVAGVVINAHDVTERRRVEVQFRQAQKMEAVGRLTAGIAHDFNNLLTAIAGYASFALAETRDDDVRADLREVVASSNRASALTRQLLAFSRQQVLRPRLLDPSRVIREMDPLIRRTLGEDVRLSMHLGEGTGPVLADPGQVEQVILNLAVNARDAMPRGGRLAIETRRLDADTRPAPPSAGRGWVSITVTDTGEGMPAEVRERIFEPFFTTKGSGKGTGLGLSTAYGIVKQSGGDINVYSEPDHGTVFKILLPIADATSDEAAAVRWSSPVAEEPAGVAPRGDGRTLLLIEDDTAVRGFITRGLEELGYVVLAPPDAEEAVALLRGDSAIDVLVTDVIMPGMSGSDVAEQARARRPGLPVLFISGYTYNQILERRVLPPDVNFLEKPFSIEALARQLATLE